MKRPHERSAVQALAKRLAPTFSKPLDAALVAHALSQAVHYLNILRGLGAGTGWAMQTEVAIATSMVDGRNPVIVDVGANRGTWSQEVFREIAHLDPRFYLFEPSPHLSGPLGEIGIPHAEVVTCAVGDSEGTAMLQSDFPGSPIASLHPRRDSYFQGARFLESVEVPVTTIDRFLELRAIESVAFMKIDAEGHDLAILEGARAALSQGRINALSFEFGSGQINSRTYFHDFWDLLAPLGFRLYRLRPGGRPLPVSTYYEDLEYFRGVSNYVAIHSRSHRLP